MRDATRGKWSWREGLRRRRTRFGLAALILLVIALGGWASMIRMPGRSHDGPLPPLTPEQSGLAARLRGDITELAVSIGERNWFLPARLEAAATYIQRRLREFGFAPSLQTFRAGGSPFTNVEVEIRGSQKPGDIVVIGAHYDTVSGCPGANDNATGVAALLALAEKSAGGSPARTLRFVAFTNEEPPHFCTGDMGSVHYAKRCRERNENIVAMVSLETMGCYSDQEGTQSYPAPLSLFYPSKGNFIAFVGNVSSRRLVRQAIETFRRQARFPSEGAALPGWLPGVGWSDHWSFWEQGYEAIMVTDTAPFRYPQYHLPEDTPDKLDIDRLARVVDGLVHVVRDLASPSA